MPTPEIAKSSCRNGPRASSKRAAPASSRNSATRSMSGDGWSLRTSSTFSCDIARPVSPLLRNAYSQPHGCEGLRVVPEALEDQDLAFAHHKDVCHLEIRVRPGACATPDHPHGNSVCGVDEVADPLPCVGVKCLAELLELAHDLLPPY